MPQRHYERLLSRHRLRTSRVRGRSLEEEAESDRGRVLFSAPFRRLQSKAQVFALETNASVRSRLTHTLEVATIGRQLAQAALNQFKSHRELEKLGLEGSERAFISFVDTACLIHDLGNPPFGHFGEAAISEWFLQHDHERVLAPPDLHNREFHLWRQYYADLTNFDGNPQGVRIITHLQSEQVADFTGLNLTVTTIAATLKYPFHSFELNADRKKPGYFKTEEDIVKQVREHFKLERNCRHPLVTLMEAADDIAYCISDLEDGIEKNIVNRALVAKILRKKVSAFKNHRWFKPVAENLPALLKDLETEGRGANSKRRKLNTGAKLTPMADIRNLVSRQMAKFVGAQYRARHLDVMRGDCTPLIPDEGPHALLEIFRGLAESHLYSSRIVRQREIAAYNTLSGLLDAYKPVMVCERKVFECAIHGKAAPKDSKKITIEASLLSLIGRKHKEAYFTALSLAPTSGKESEVHEKILRIRMIVDFISGMTDDFALRIYQLVSSSNVAFISS